MSALEALRSISISFPDPVAHFIKELFKSKQVVSVCGRETVDCSAVDGHFRTMNGSCNNPLHPFWGSGNFCVSL